MRPGARVISVVGRTEDRGHAAPFGSVWRVRRGRSPGLAEAVRHVADGVDAYLRRVQRQMTAAASARGDACFRSYLSDPLRRLAGRHSAGRAVCVRDGPGSRRAGPRRRGRGGAITTRGRTSRSSPGCGGESAADESVQWRCRRGTAGPAAGTGRADCSSGWMPNVRSASLSSSRGPNLRECRVSRVTVPAPSTEKRIRQSETRGTPGHRQPGAVRPVQVAPATSLDSIVSFS